MTTVEVNQPVSRKLTHSDASFHGKKQKKTAKASQDVAPPVPPTVPVEPHPLADLFGKYSGEIWDEIFDALERDRQAEDAAASRE